MSMRRALRHLGIAVLVIAGSLAAGCGSEDNRVDGPDAIAPAAPRGLRADAGDNNGERDAPTSHIANIRLEWESNEETDIAGYKLYMAQAGGDYELVSIVSAETFDFTDQRERGFDYAYMLKAIDDSENESGPSNVVTVRPAIGGGNGD